MINPEKHHVDWALNAAEQKLCKSSRLYLYDLREELAELEGKMTELTPAVETARLKHVDNLNHSTRQALIRAYDAKLDKQYGERTDMQLLSTVETMSHESGIDPGAVYAQLHKAGVQPMYVRNPKHTAEVEIKAAEDGRTTYPLMPVFSKRPFDSRVDTKTAMKALTNLGRALRDAQKVDSLNLRLHTMLSSLFLSVPELSSGGAYLDLSDEGVPLIKTESGERHALDIEQDWLAE